jgi:hypothetical protein
MLAFVSNPVTLTWEFSGAAVVDNSKIESLSGVTSLSTLTTIRNFTPGLACGDGDAFLFMGPSEDVGFACGSVGYTSQGELSLSSNQAGTEITIQLITDAGVQICTALNEPCGSHGDCCIGLSCQATDGGCGCLYAWPE